MLVPPSHTNCTYYSPARMKCFVSSPFYIGVKFSYRFEVILLSIRTECYVCYCIFYNGRVVLQYPVCHISIVRLKYSYAYDTLIRKCNNKNAEWNFLYKPTLNSQKDHVLKHTCICPYRVSQPRIMIT